MFSPDEITALFEGRLGRSLELTYVGEQGAIRLEFVAPRHLRAYIPRRHHHVDRDFSIESHLAATRCGAPHALSEFEYLIEIVERYQIRTTLKVAMNYLDWREVERLRSRIRS